MELQSQRVAGDDSFTAWLYRPYVDLGPRNDGFCVDLPFGTSQTQANDANAPSGYCLIHFESHYCEKQTCLRIG